MQKKVGLQSSSTALEKKKDLPKKHEEALFIDDKMAPSQTSEEDAEERLDCVHDINSNRRGQHGRVSVLAAMHQMPSDNYYDNIYGQDYGEEATTERRYTQDADDEQ